VGRSHSDDFVGRVLDFGPGRLLLLAQRQVTLMFSFADVKGEYREKKGKRYREHGETQNFNLQIQNLELLFTALCKFSLTLFKFAILFKIRCTIQIRNMNSARALTGEWIRHPIFATIEGTTMLIQWVEH